ncbi:spermidine/putrescine transport system permease protein [Clostridium sp. USBA 49]|uniref:ABC transporter permease n=1 Tax=Clostridium sp. USBA 49 TaxID=1881060 RepID=UPI0009998622|nr:ABC transporter permease [Clostridium sp. USBA 49]SKA72918.1 spermidine/putrescine transport system permease protein [Clostridium sp. USBA 49]
MILQNKAISINKTVDTKKVSDKNLLSGITTILPILVWMIAFFVVPLIFIIIVSFCTRGETGEIIYKFTLSNYIKLLNPLYIKIFFNSIIIAVFTTLICLILGYPFAYIVANAKKRYKPILLLLIILPFFTNSLVRTYSMIILLRSEGIINSYLIKFHIISQPLKLLYNNISVMIGMTYMMFPFMVLPLYASIEKLDKRFIEAGADLGATRLKIFFKIVLPLTKGGIISGSMLVFVPALGLFFITDLMGGSKVVLMSNLIKNQFLTARNWPLGSAISVLLIAIMVLAIILGTRNSNEKNKMGVM